MNDNGRPGCSSGADTSNRRWFQQDERGSIVSVTDGIGASIAINAYDEFGIPGSGNLGRFQYTGQTWLPEVGMYYYKARIYSPNLGRFLQTDPIGYGDDLNLYAYTSNDPLNKTDPSGNCPLCITTAVGVIAGAGIEAAVQIYTSGKITDGGAIVAAAVKGGFIGLTGGAGAEFTAFAGAGKIGQVVDGAVSGALGNSVMSPLVDAAKSLDNVGSPGHYAAESAGVAVGYAMGSAAEKGMEAVAAVGGKLMGELAENGAVKAAVSNVSDAAASSRTQKALEGAPKPAQACSEPSKANAC